MRNDRYSIPLRVGSWAINAHPLHKLCIQTARVAFFIRGGGLCARLMCGPATTHLRSIAHTPLLCSSNMATPSQLLMEQINARYEEDRTIAPDRMICLLTMIKKSNEKLPPGFISNVRFLLGESLKKKDQTIKFFGASASFLKKYGSKDDVQNLMTYVGSTGIVIQPSFVRQYLVTLAWHDINAAYLEFVEYTHTGLVRESRRAIFRAKPATAPSHRF